MAIGQFGMNPSTTNSLEKFDTHATTVYRLNVSSHVLRTGRADDCSVNAGYRYRETEGSLSVTLVGKEIIIQRS
jgi:hypothetical protein